jgi:hypothetical protein
MPKGREWTTAERAMWRALWRSPQACEYDDSHVASVPMFVAHTSAVLAGTAAAWQASEARQLADRLGFSPQGGYGALDGSSRAIPRRASFRCVKSMTSRRLVRAQTRYGVVPGEMPPEFRVGRCLEIWGDGNGGDDRAFTRYRKGLDAYAVTIAGAGLLARRRAPALPPGPRSTSTLTDAASR